MPTKKWSSARPNFSKRALKVPIERATANNQTFVLSLSGILTGRFVLKMVARTLMALDISRHGGIKLMSQCKKTHLEIQTVKKFK